MLRKDNAFFLEVVARQRAGPSCFLTSRSPNKPLLIDGDANVGAAQRGRSCSKDTPCNDRARVSSRLGRVPLAPRRSGAPRLEPQPSAPRARRGRRSARFVCLEQLRWAL